MSAKKKAIYCFSVFLISFSTFFLLLPEFFSNAFIFELLQQYRLQLSFFSFLGVLILLLLRRYLFCLFQMVLVIFSVFIVWEGYTPRSVSGQCSVGTPSLDNFRVMSFNIYKDNTQYRAIVEAVDRVNPDVVLFQEVLSGFYHKSHETLLGNYPFYHSELEHGVPQGRAIYSKFPIESAQRRYLYGNKHHLLHAKVNFKGNVIDFLNVHTASPKNMARVMDRMADIEALKRFVKETLKGGGHMVVAGDFNSAPWHPTMREFKLETSLNNNLFYNIIPTWPTWLPAVFNVPIDHVFYSGNFYNPLYFKGLGGGSDHYAIYVDLNMCK